jgi:hypothetical protein
LLHQQPLFTEGHHAFVGAELPRTEAANQKLIRFPVFTLPASDLIDQYAFAVEKVIANADEINRKYATMTNAYL